MSGIDRKGEGENGIRRRTRTKVDDDGRIPKLNYDDGIELYLDNLLDYFINQSKAIAETKAFCTFLRVFWFWFSFFVDAGSPLVLLFMLLDVTVREPGIPLLINVVASIYIAYGLCTEKYSSSAEKPSSTKFASETMRKAVSLMFSWFNWGRSKKQKRKMKLLDDKISSVKSEIPFFRKKRRIKVEVLKNMKEFFRSNLRYAKEDTYLLTWRSFTVAFYYMCLLVQPDNFAMPLCEFDDVCKLAFLMFTLVKASYIFKKLQDAREYYIASHHLTMFSVTKGQLGYVRRPTLVIHKEYCCQLICAYIVSCSINLVQLGGTILATTLLLTTKKYTWFVVHTVVTFTSYTLREYIFWSRLPLSRAGLFSIQCDITFSQKIQSNLWLRVNTSSNFVKSLAKWAPLYNISPTLCFLLAFTTFTPAESNPKLMCSINYGLYSNFSHHENLWYTLRSTWNSIKWKLTPNPVNIIDFIGGIYGGVLIVNALLVISFLLDGLQRYLQICNNTSLDISKYISMLENMHAFRCLFEIVSVKSTQSGNENENNDNMKKDIEAAHQTVNYSFLPRFEALMHLNDSQFEDTWSNFIKSKQLNLESLNYRSKESAFVLLTQRHKYWKLDQIPILNGLMVSLRLILYGFVEDSVREIIKSFHDHVNKLGRPKLKNWSLERLKQEEKFALSILKSLNKKGRPICGASDKLYILSQIFIRILNQNNNADKDQDLNNLAVFSDILDDQLCEMSPFRIHATLVMLTEYLQRKK